MDNATKCQTHNTQRLIDVNALKEAWKDVAVDGATLSYIYGLFKSVDNAPTIDAVPREDYISMERTLARLQQGIADATDAPTIDAVEVVRCKDCRFAEHREQAERVYCHRERLAISCPPRDNDDFCKYGERSE